MKTQQEHKLEQPVRKPTAPALRHESFHLISLATYPNNRSSIPASEEGLDERSDSESSLGLGFFSPDILQEGPLYFYGQINWDKPVHDHAPQDSVTFKKTEYGSYEISSAPPYFYPALLKLDYDILFLKVITAGREFLEVEVNKKTGQTAYVDRFKGQLKYWPDFLLRVHSVEFNDAGSAIVKIKPLDHAAEVRLPFIFMQPQLVKDDWMKVDLLDNHFRKTGNGWIKWKQNNQLLITYSLLS